MIFVLLVSSRRKWKEVDATSLENKATLTKMFLSINPFSPVTATIIEFRLNSLEELRLRADSTSWLTVCLLFCYHV